MITNQREKRGCIRRGSEERRELVRAFRSSGLSQAAFARHEGIHPVTLGHWLRRDGGSGGPARRRKIGAFTRVDVAMAHAPIEIELRSGLRIRLQDARRLHELVTFFREVGAC
jgi:transposase-like protein